MSTTDNLRLLGFKFGAALADLLSMQEKLFTLKTVDSGDGWRCCGWIGWHGKPVGRLWTEDAPRLPW